MLLMKKVFFDAIRSGRKTTTVRYWRWPRVREGAVCRISGLGKLRIDRVRCIGQAELSDEDARLDGFENLTALQQALGKMYPANKRKGRKFYQIHFTFLCPDKPSPDHFERRAGASQSGR